MSTISFLSRCRQDSALQFHETDILKKTERIGPIRTELLVSEMNSKVGEKRSSQ
jgi:hypothetical protein